MDKVKIIPAGKQSGIVSSKFDSRPLPFNTSEKDWRYLTAEEIDILKNNGNNADNWKNIKVGENFNPQKIENSRFYGIVRISGFSDSFLEYHDLTLPAGIYSSVIVSCDIGRDTAIHNVKYLSYYVIESGSILFNINELAATGHSKFGNGIIAENENEDVRIWLELANENGGRKVLPFDGMLPSDAWIWQKYRNEKELMSAFIRVTENTVRPLCFTPGKIGSGSVIKDCRIIKDVKTGENTYIKGANKLKNLTINSSFETQTQIGEGCELVNGIIGRGCHIFYGVKAVRFILSDHSNLKYGARLINSYLGPNSTISCCEVLNSLIFGSHEQHHNSSFLCASVLKGQTNMASAATVGSNHNSRASDGEIVAERGFWPGLSVSLKHNSYFAAFTILAKGAYPKELNIQLPFSLVSNDEHNGELIIMPGYWFRYNMYALARNSAKSAARDKREEKKLNLVFNWLAPDTVNQIRKALHILEVWADGHPEVKNGSYESGRDLLEKKVDCNITASEKYPVENSRRPVKIIHASRAWKDYIRMLRYFSVKTILEYSGIDSLYALIKNAKNKNPQINIDEWENTGGQLIQRKDLENLKKQITSGKLSTWQMVHSVYRESAEKYEQQKFEFAISVLTENLIKYHSSLYSESAEKIVSDLLKETLNSAEFIYNGIIESRKKDYTNYFRKITFSNDDEMISVLGSFNENSFIKEAEKEYLNFQEFIESFDSGSSRIMS